MVDASWALANRGDGTFDREHDARRDDPAGRLLVGRAPRSACSAARCSATPQTLGLDAMFPAFYLALLAEEMRDRAALSSALLGAAIALCLVPFAPPGIPVVAASRPRCSACASADDHRLDHDRACWRSGTVAIKAAGPVALGGRDLPPRLDGVVARLAPACWPRSSWSTRSAAIAALVIDETAVGLLAAAAALAREAADVRRRRDRRGRRPPPCAPCI